MKLPDELIRGVLVPFLQSVATGVLVTLAGFGVCAWQHWPGWWSVVIGAMAALFSWWVNMARWQRLIEQILAPDLNPCQEAPQVQPADPQSIRLEIAQRNEAGYLEGQYINLPIDPDRLRILADGLEQGKSLTVASWTGSHGIFSRSEFERVRDEFVIRGLIRPTSERSHQRGYELTLAGRHVFKKLTTPPPGRK